MSETKQQLASFLTEPPVVFLALTQGEMFFTGGLAAGLAVVIGLPAGLLAGSVFIAVLMGAMTLIITAVVVSRKLKKIRATRPRGYISDLFHINLQQYGLGDPVITGSQRYRKGRKLRL